MPLLGRSPGPRVTGPTPLRHFVARTANDGLRAGTVDAPAAVHVLQNNWFRLLGSGGALVFDRGGEARFDQGLVLSPGFLRTRLFGGRPDGREVRNERVDFLSNGRRGDGGYGEAVRNHSWTLFS